MIAHPITRKHQQQIDNTFAHASSSSGGARNMTVYNDGINDDIGISYITFCSANRAFGVRLTYITYLIWQTLAWLIYLDHARYVWIRA